MKERPKIALCNIGMESYKRDILVQMVENSIRKLNKECEVVYSGEIFEIEEAIPAAQRVLRENPDILVILFSTWTFAPIPVAVIREAGNIPILLWAIPMTEGTTTGSLVAFCVAKGTLERMRKKFDWVYGMPEEVIPKIIQQAKLARIITELRQSRIGLIGGAAEGMFSADSDRLLLHERLGPEIVHIDGSIILHRMQQIQEEEDIEKELEKIRSKIIIEGNDLLEKAKRLIRMYIVMKEIIAKENLSALSHKCMYEMSSIVGCACLPLSLLVDEGIMCSDEGDIHAVITMMMMNKITEQPVYFSDFMNAEGKFIWFSTCGFIAPSLAKSGAILRHQCAEIGEKGAIVSAEPKEGEVTIARVDKGTGDNYRMHIAKGEIVKGYRRRYVTNEGKELLLFPICKVKLKEDSNNFLRKVMSNHYLLSWNDCMEDMMKLAEMMGIEII